MRSEPGDRGSPCPVFVVSLPSSTARRRAFAARAGAALLSWEFFDAREGLDPGLGYDPPLALLHYGRALTPGELGCYSSHFALWEKMLTSGADQIIVLEDDVAVDWDMLAILAKTRLAPQGLTFLRLHYLAPSRFIVRTRDYLRHGTSLIELTSPAWGTHGYVMTRQAAAKLVPFCRRVIRPIDDQLDRFWEHGVPNMSLFPFPLIGDLAPSIIGERRAPFASPSLRRRLVAWRDRSRRTLAHWSRRSRRFDAPPALAPRERS